MHASHIQSSAEAEACKEDNQEMQTLEMQMLDMSFQRSDKVGSSIWLSYPKKSSMSALGQAFGINNSLMMSTAFALVYFSFVATLVRSTGDLLLKLCKAEKTLGVVEKLLFSFPRW